MNDSEERAITTERDGGIAGMEYLSMRDGLQSSEGAVFPQIVDP